MTTHPDREAIQAARDERPAEYRLPPDRFLLSMLENVLWHIRTNGFDEKCQKALESRAEEWEREVNRALKYIPHPLDAALQPAQAVRRIDGLATGDYEWDLTVPPEDAVKRPLQEAIDFKWHHVLEANPGYKFSDFSKETWAALPIGVIETLRIAARAVLQEAGTDAGGWKTIDSAPKDGTWIWLCDNTLGGDDLNMVKGQFADWGVWQTWDSDDYNPTHWMPLPPAPQKGD